MRCPTCQEVTESDRQWCARCGAPLMFGDERAPAPLDRPLDLDRRCDGALDGIATAAPDPADAAPPPDPVQMPLGHLVERRPAAVRRRVLAAAIDLGLLMAAGGFPIALAVRPGAAAAGGSARFAACITFLALLAFTYATLGHALMGATIGKRVLGLRVEGPDGAAPGLARCMARSAVAVAGAAALGAGLAIGLLSRRGQALHDLLAGTCVVAVPIARR